MEDWVVMLCDEQVGSVKENISLSSYTTWKIGGPADVLVEPEDDEQLQRILRFAHRQQIPVTLLGRGSNILIRDGGIRGIVIRLGEGFERMNIQGETIRVGAAYSLIKLSAIAAKEALSGLEFAGGIPATIGGAVFMNAGAHGADFSSIFVQAEGFELDGKSAVWTSDDLKFHYRHSSLQERHAVVTTVVLKLQTGDRQQIAEVSAANKQRRLQTQPLMLPCCGSVFRNPLVDPERMYAAQLIEQAGLKGKRIGDAEVSPMHANFMINVGHAKATDVISLIDLIRNNVHEQFDVWLEPEVKILGTDTPEAAPA